MRTLRAGVPHRLDRSGNARARLPPSIEATARSRRPIDRADGIPLGACKPVQCLTYEPDRLTLSNSNRPGTAQNARLRNSVLDPPTAHLSRADRGCGGTGTTSSPRSSRRNRPHISSKIHSANLNLVYHRPPDPIAISMPQFQLRLMRRDVISNVISRSVIRVAIGLTAVLIRKMPVRLKDRSESRVIGTPSGIDHFRERLTSKAHTFRSILVWKVRAPERGEAG